MTKAKGSKEATKVFTKKVVLSKDGKKLLFTSVKKARLLQGRKFRQHPELGAFYHFVHENNLRVEACGVFFQLIEERKRESVKDKRRRRAGLHK